MDSLNTKLEADLIFVDDDRELTLAWNMAAKLVGKKIVTFNDINIFKKTINSYSKNTPLYIDSNLFNEKGENLAKELYELGFINIYLATGYEKDSFSKDMYWIKDIVGKEPPFFK